MLEIYRFARWLYLYKIPLVPRVLYALVGSGAQMSGAIRIGRGAQIGANPVALQDAPAGAMAVSTSARIIMPFRRVMEPR